VSGGYRVFIRQASQVDYQLWSTTPKLTDSDAQLTGLTPLTDYKIVLRTAIPSNSFNSSTLESAFSQELSFRTGDLKNLYFPLFTQDRDIWTGFAISNCSAVKATLTFTAYAPSGGLLALPQNPAVTDLPPGNQMARLGSEIFVTQGLDPLLGWVQLTSDNSNIGSFFLIGNSIQTQMDGAIPANVLSKKMVFTRAFEGTSGYRGQSAKTLLSIANPNNDPIAVKLTLYQIMASNAAQTSLEQTRTIAGHG